MAIESILHQFIKSIQDESVLDRIADRIQPPLRRVFRDTRDPGRQLKNILSGTWIGEPLHPVLKELPVGAWSMAALFDAIDVIRGDTVLQNAADISIGTGVLGALASVVTGLCDWADTTGRARRIGTAHAMLNVSATTLYAAALAVRGIDRDTRTRVAFCGYAVMLLAAYLGGNLVFGEQVGVNHARLPALSRDFSPVMQDADLPEGAPRRVDFKGLPVVLVRQASKIYALYEKCSHLGGPLAYGKLEEESIRCPWHGSRFSLEDGQVCEGPATNPQASFETRVENGQILIRAREAESP